MYVYCRFGFGFRCINGSVGAFLRGGATPSGREGGAAFCAASCAASAAARSTLCSFLVAN